MSVFYIYIPLCTVLSKWLPYTCTLMCCEGCRKRNWLLLLRAKWEVAAYISGGIWPVLGVPGCEAEEFEAWIFVSRRMVWCKPDLGQIWLQALGGNWEKPEERNMIRSSHSSSATQWQSGQAKGFETGKKSWVKDSREGRQVASHN